MPKKISFTVKESVDFLNRSYSKTTGRLQRDRIKTLLYLATEKYHYQSDIANRLGRTEKTVRDWLKLYSSEGFSALIKVKSGGNNTRTLSDKVITSIEEKVTDPKTTITSYVELQLLLEEETKEKVAYGPYIHIAGENSRPSSKWSGNHITKKTRTQKRFLKNLKTQFTLIRTGLNRDNIKSVNLYFQDESRFGLITKQKRVITAKGIKPIGTYRHSYLYK